MLAGVVTFEIAVSHLEGEFKLSQNKPQPDRDNVQRELSASPHAHGREVAAMMEGAAQS